jgi:UDP-N-acetylglucosamine 2-epimerase (non-hydrolysing)
MMTSIDRLHLLCVVGARPNFMKIAPIMRAFADSDAIDAVLVHTGQHYDAAMMASFFAQLGIPAPDVDLEVGSGSHAVQTADIMKRFEPVLAARACDAVLVVGDVNSTIACALVAAKEGVPVIHVEAGLRSFDRSMPEEINRILTDQLSDLLFTTERSAAVNLEREGISRERVRFVGNVMIDTLLRNRARCPRAVDVLSVVTGSARCFGAAGFGVVTLHRPANVDTADSLTRIVDVLCEVAADLPLVFAVHPRTRARLGEFGLLDTAARGLLLMPPLPYLELLALVGAARVVLTDSGGLQEETTALGVPCLTLRENTERPITVEEGTNTVVGTNPVLIRGGVRAVLAGGGKRGRVPELWDGRAAERIRDEVVIWAAGRRPLAVPSNQAQVIRGRS